MKYLVILLTLFITTTAFAETINYKLDMNLSVNGETISNPKMIVLAGETGTITSESDNVKNYIEVIADEGNINGNKGILMKFKIGHILKDGSKKIISHPTLLTKNGEEASITVQGNDHREQMTLKVIASRDL